VSDLRTEEEQVAAIKQWWKDNGTSIMVGIVVALVAIFGWRAWQQKTMEAKIISSQQFQQLLEATTGDTAANAEQTGANIAFLVDEILKQNNESRYGIYARLLKARVAVSETRYDEAEALLRESLAKNTDPALATVINARLVRLLAIKGDTEAALKILAEPQNALFAGYFEELKGDLLKAQGKRAEAREAYQKAVDGAALTGEDTRLLQMKLDDLAGA
jgi:predicted negative regulator of RcsB-dependent stress response